MRPTRLLAILLTLAAAPLGASNHVPRTAAPIVIDGLADEEAWAAAWSTELAYEVRPGENVPPPVRTEVRLTYDDRALYVAFRAFDPDPRAIRAHLSARDNIYDDDWVAVILDTFNDERRAFDLFVNPVGVQADQIETSSGEEEWDAIWDAASRITEWGWSAEMRVPFSSLRFQPGEGPRVWGFDAVRSYPRAVRSHIGTFPRDRRNNCYFCQMIKLQGFDGVSGSRNLEIVPTFTSLRSDARAPGGGMDSGSVNGEAGLTARWGMTPGLTLAATLNPDFSQVEADSPQLDVNEPFALSFAEKRPFFMEASDFFRTRLDAVYTRAVRDPAWGVKLTGKDGPDTIGVFILRDEVTNLLLPGSRSSSGTTLEGASDAAVARYKRDLGSRLTLGALATAREGEGYSNRLAGFDVDWRLSNADRLRVQLLGSRSELPTALSESLRRAPGSFSDWAGELRYDHSTRTFDAWAVVRDIGEDFRADLGFMPRVDTRLTELGAAYHWVPTPGAWFTGLQVKAVARDATDHAGALLYRESIAEVEYQGPYQTHAVARGTWRRESWAGQEFDKREVLLHNCMVPRSGTGFHANLTFGDQIDYANARLGRRLKANGGIQQRAGRHLTLYVNATVERMDVHGERLYTARIGEAQATVQLSTRTAVRALAQGRDTSYSVAMYLDPRPERERRLLSQLLFSYTVNPQTVLFLGYGDTADDDGRSELRRSGRTLFAKVGYAWSL